ncbi:MAG: hypothetical protein QOC72_3403 [Methylobacteriaceae bacterium]|jgi:hypothetical protein|nr:hypothetical protein [Methylobacteriaceae bacterium]
MSAKDKRMAEQLRPLRDKLGELDRQIEELLRRLGEAQAAKKTLQEVLAQMQGQQVPVDNGEGSGPRKRTRTPNVKGTILDIMLAAGATGRTSAEVLAEAHNRGTPISRDTVSSVLSRLKADKALSHDGTRYYAVSADKDPRPALRAVV